MSTTSTEVQVPQPAELAEASEVLSSATEKAELVRVRLEQIVCGVVPPATMTAEQAWALTLFARGLRMEAADLVKWAKEIDDLAEWIWNA